MKVLVVASQKGGSGKSTIAAHLSIYANKPERPALLIDTDPQGSLKLWHDLRKAETPVLVRCAARELPATLDAAKRDGIEWVIVDTPPHNAADIATALRQSDLALIPTRPAVFDLASVQATIEMARDLKRWAAVVINAAPPKRDDVEAAVVAEARQALASFGARIVWRGQLTQRAVLGHALGSGMSAQEFEPSSIAASEMSFLWRSILHQFEMGRAQP